MTIEFFLHNVQVLRQMNLWNYEPSEQWISKPVYMNPSDTASAWIMFNNLLLFAEGFQVPQGPETAKGLLRLFQLDVEMDLNKCVISHWKKVFTSSLYDSTFWSYFQCCNVIDVPPPPTL